MHRLARVFLVASFLASAAPAADAGRLWAAIAEEDLRAMYAQIKANHPGPVDPRNPGFKVWLERGFKEGLGQARAARTPGAYLAVLRRYAAGFRDGHLGVSFELGLTRIGWPGFVVGLRGDRYEVVAHDPKATRPDPAVPPVGAVVKECDGLTPQQLVERDALPYQPGPMLERTWVAAAATLLQDRGYPGFARAKVCTVEVGGQTQAVTLRYRNISPDALNELVQVAGFGKPPDMGVRTFGEGGSVWVSLPTFSSAEDPAIGERLKALIADAPGWRTVPVVVFDVRGNTGGSSAFGTRMAQSLYGDAFHAHLAAADRGGAPQFVDWRASKDNAAYMHELVRLVTAQFGAESETAEYFRVAAKGVNEAYRKGQPLWHRDEPEEPAAVTPAGPPPENPVRARVYLLTDGRCASACLDFADELLQRPFGVTHVGVTTSADSVYMEVRPAKLPSGAASVNLPTKVYRNRPRGHNAPYEPQHRFPGHVGDTAAVERWLLELDATRARDAK